MIQKIKKFIETPFIRNVTVLASGTAAAQLITMALSPIITRMYGPEAFGIMGTFTAIVGTIIPIAALTYPIAIVLPKSNLIAKDLIRLSLIITMLTSVISLILILLFDNKLVELFNLQKISAYLYLIPLVIIFSGLMQVAEQWLIRTKQFSINARVTFLQSIILNGSKVGIGTIYPIPAVLVVLSALGNGIRAFLMMIFANWHDINVESKSKRKRNNLWNLAKEYYDFPIYRAPEVFLNAISGGLPVLMLTAFFGPISAGFYSLGRTVLRIPSQLIGKAVGDVFYPRFSQAANNNENLTPLLTKATFVLAGVGIVPFGLIVLFGPFLFSFVFGKDWIIAGEYARWIALWSYCGFINRPSVHSLPVLNAQRFHLFYTILMLIVRLGVLFLGYFIFTSDKISIALFGITGALLNIGLIIYTLKISKSRDKNN